MKKKTLFTLSYIVILHVFVVVIFLKPGFYNRINPFGKKSAETREIIYNNMVAFHQRIDANIKDNPVIFIGDSIIQGMCTTCITKNSINFGVGQDTTVGVLRRINLYSSLKHAKAIVLAIGLNDIKTRNNDEILYNYRQILQSIPTDKPVIFSAILPIALNPRRSFNTNIRITTINKEAEKICNSHTNCLFVNFGAQLVDQNNQLAALYHIGDGIHPNPVGYQKLISAFRTVLLQRGVACTDPDNKC